MGHFCRKYGLLFLSLFFFLKVEGHETLFEGKGSYYYCTNSRFRDLYNCYGLYNLEANFQTWNNWYSWVDVGYLYGSGHNSQHHHNHIHLVPLSVGFSYLFKFDSVSPYLGAGPLLAYSRIKNDSKHVTQHQNGWGGGFLAKSGCLVYVGKDLFIDFFASYSFIRVSYHHGNKYTQHHRGDLSGLGLGGGIGYRF